MSDYKVNCFNEAYGNTARHVRSEDLVNRAKYTHEYLEDLVNKKPEIASFTVAEIIEHLNRRL